MSVNIKNACASYSSVGETVLENVSIDKECDFDDAFND